MEYLSLDVKRPSINQSINEYRITYLIMRNESVPSVEEITNWNENLFIMSKPASWLAEKSKSVFFINN